MDEDDAPAGIPEWVVTFGDMMSLLLTFFIMLVSMSEIKQEDQYQAMVESMRRQFGHDLSMAAIIPGEHPPMNSAMLSMAAMSRAKRSDIVQGGAPVKSANGDDHLVQTIRPGRDKRTGGVVFFAEDSATLDGAARDALALVAADLAGKPQKIEVRGHASRKPAPVGEDHWSLAMARSRAVMEFLIEAGVEPERVRLGSAGAYEPIDSGADTAARERNARVEVLLWDEPVTRTTNTP